MTLTELRYIVAVARERHFGRAAEACFVSQPTLSVAIKKLEDELDVKLFERGASEVSVTPLGQEIVRQAQAVIEQAAAIKEIAKRGKDPVSGPLRLGVIYTIGPYLLPDLVKQAIDPTFGPLQQTLIGHTMKRLQQPSALPTGFAESGIEQINKTYNAGRQSIENILTGRGLATSPAAATPLVNNEGARINEVARFRRELPLLNRELEQQDLQNALAVLGMGRYSGERLEWFRIFTLSPRPKRVWDREQLFYDGRREPIGAEQASLYPDHVVIRCASRTGEVELAMSPASLTGFQAWLEAKPPGSDWDRR